MGNFYSVGDWCNDIVVWFQSKAVVLTAIDDPVAASWVLLGVIGWFVCMLLIIGLWASFSYDMASMRTYILAQQTRMPVFR